MANLLTLPNGNLVSPALIRGVVKFPGKGVALRNEFNKIMDFIREADERRQAVIAQVLKEITSNRDWEQPDWATEFATAP